ncbi:MAG: DUF456 domain-containing protein [Verrucomicrobiaceae bacterium]
MIDSITHFFTAIDWSFWGVWSFTAGLMVLGLAGAVLPLLPGPILIFAGALAHVLLRPESGASWWCVAGLFVLTMVAYVLDFMSGAAGTRWFGGSQYAVWGVLVGGILGLFVPFPGLLIAPILGGFAFEMLFAKKELRPAVKSSVGTVVGAGMGLVLRLIVSLLMVSWFVADVIW